MIIKRDMLYTPAGTNRTLHIYLPDDYYESNEQYAVMYFFDGHNLFRDEDATYGKSWGLEPFLKNWRKKMIIVGMECSHEGKSRLDEYCPYDSHGSFLGDIHGMGKETMDWIVNEVKPMIDKEYRTYYFREATGIAGSSMGGLMALYAAGKYNRWFSKAGCISSAIGFVEDALLADLSACDISPDTRVYLSWGTEESGGARKRPEEDYFTTRAYQNRRASELFQQRGATTFLYCQRGGGHCEADWEQLVPHFMEFLWF